jgi:hypothetical protein
VEVEKPALGSRCKTVLPLRYALSHAETLRLHPQEYIFCGRAGDIGSHLQVSKRNALPAPTFATDVCGTIIKGKAGIHNEAVFRVPLPMSDPYTP